MKPNNEIPEEIERVTNYGLHHEQGCKPSAIVEKFYGKFSTETTQELLSSKGFCY